MPRHAAALALAAAAMLWAGAAGAATLVVGKAAGTADALIPVNVGFDLGIFKRRGLEVKIVDFTGGGKMFQALVAGAIDIAVGAGSELSLVAKGVPMLGVCESTRTLPFLSIGVPWDSPIKSVQDLKGKRIAVSTAGSLTEWLALELARKMGWGPDGITTVAVGNGSASETAAIREHLVDAVVGGTSLFLDLEEKQQARLLLPVSDYEGPVASGTLFASRRLIERDPDALRAFLAGWIETIQYIRTHKAETVKIESGITGFPDSVTAKDYDLTIGMFTKDCRFDAESLAALKRSIVDLKLLDQPPADMSALYTEAFLPP